MPKRTNPRHAAFDYRAFAAYFVTICTHERRCLFGAIRRGRMVLNEYGKIVVEEWKRSEAMRDEVVLDAFVVMPNHLHGIVCLVPPGVDDVSPRGYDLDVGRMAMRPYKRGTSIFGGKMGVLNVTPNLWDRWSPGSKGR